MYIRVRLYIIISQSKSIYLRKKACLLVYSWLSVQHVYIPLPPDVECFAAKHLSRILAKFYMAMERVLHR